MKLLDLPRVGAAAARVLHSDGRTLLPSPQNLEGACNKSICCFVWGNMRHPFVSASLRLGICVPFIYFGIQLLAIPFYPGFNILVNSASDLGTAHSLKPWILNLGAIVTGLITLASVYGFYQSLRSSGTNVLPTALVCLSLICYGSSSLAAGLFPMPHPYHGAGPAQLGIILGPALFAAAFWKRRRESGWVFWCLAACFALFAVVLVFMRPAVTGVNTDPIMGLLQRILAIAGFAPLGLAAYDLLKQRIKQLQVGARKLAQPRSSVQI